MRGITVLAISLIATQSFAIALFDGNVGVMPDHATFGWTYSSAANGTGQGMVTGPNSFGPKVTMVSDDLFQQGYGKISPMALNRTTGYSVSFDVQMAYEYHTGSDKNNDLIDDRAGFSVTVIGNDKKGVELGFWEDQIFAQQTDFTHNLVETAYGSTKEVGTGVANLPHYRLDVKGNNYTLFREGSQILAGALKDYSGSGLPAYNTGNSIFVGDNTTSAGAQARWSSMSVEAVPEPATLFAIGVGAVGTLARKRK